MLRKSTDGINFIPPNAQQTASLGQQIFRLMVSKGKTVIVLTEAAVLLVFLSKFKLDRKIHDLEDRIESKDAILRSSKKLELEHKRIQRKINLVSSKINSQINWQEKMNEFDNIIPQGMILETVTYSIGEIQIKATVDSAGAFATFIEKLTSEDSVKSVILKSSVYRKETNQYNFSMQIITTENKP